MWKENIVTAEQLISSSETKPVHCNGNIVIKEFCEGFLKVEVLNETLYNTRMEIIEALNIPKVLGVPVIDDKQSITREFVGGKTPRQLMEENPDKTGEHLEQTVDLHLLIFAQICPLLSKSKEKIIHAFKLEEQLNENLRYELLTKLDGTPKYTKLCHGNFYLSNIIVGDDGKWYLVGRAYASQGNVNVDVAKTYLFLSLKNKKTTNMYIDLFCVKTGTEKRHTQGWPLTMAAAQLTHRRPEEKELLENWINVSNYQ